MYQIHEVCERCHLSRKAIRLYEEKGLLHPEAGTAEGCKQCYTCDPAA